MGSTWPDDPAQFRGSGTVWLGDDDGDIGGYWDGHPARDGPLEQLPRGLSWPEAARWATERTPRIFVRFGGDGYYVVGEDNPVQPSGTERSAFVGRLTLDELLTR